MLNVTKGILVEYALSVPPLMLQFEFNPRTLTRSRTITIPAGNAAGTRCGYDFILPTDTARVAQGVTAQPEQFSLEILLDATDRMNDPGAVGHTIATEFGIEPEISTLRLMVEPKSQGPLGLQTLSSLGLTRGRGLDRDKSVSVLLLIWGTHVLPVFPLSVTIVEQAHLPSLVPYRAEATLSVQIIESNNPFYLAEIARQVIGAGLNAEQTVVSAIGDLF